MTLIDTINYSMLQPKLWPDEAKTDFATFGASLTLAKGTVLGKKTSDGKLYAYNNSNSDGTETAVAILAYAIRTDSSGNVYLGDSSTASYQNLPHFGHTVFVSGTFATTDLTGWDANARTDFGARTLHNGFVRIP